MVGSKGHGSSADRRTTMDKLAGTGRRAQSWIIGRPNYYEDRGRERRACFIDCSERCRGRHGARSIIVFLRQLALMTVKRGRSNVAPSHLKKVPADDLQRTDQ